MTGARYVALLWTATGVWLVTRWVWMAVAVLALLVWAAVRVAAGDVRRSRSADALVSPVPDPYREPSR